MTRVSFDTNVLVYALGVNDQHRQARAEALIIALPQADVVLSVQALGELFRVLTGKARWPATTARLSLQKYQNAYAVHPTTTATLTAALDLAVDHRLSVWDAVILNAAAESGCRLLLSEDFSEGFTWRGVTVTNPFSAKPNPLLPTIQP
jgi:predicted nucleic acid-binding protein